MKKILLVSAVAALASVAAQAESNYNTTTGTSASAKLDFKIVIPKVIFLQVGTGTASPLPLNVTTVDELSFSPTAAQVGDSTAIAGVGGDLAGGKVTVRVLANGGAVTLNSNNTGPMANTGGGAATIGWDQIQVTPGVLATPSAPAAGWSNVAITHPAFNTGGSGGAGTGITLSSPSGVVKTEGMWTFAYANTTTPVAGTYGTSTHKGRVTYTATQP